MGSGVSTNFGFRKPEVMNVDPVEEVDKRTHTFSRAMFKKLEWEVMKAFCQKYKIKQAHLIVVFQRYLTHDEVYIREFKVRTKDPKMLYLRESRLQQELAEIFIPSIFMKSFTGLETMESSEEVSFARFVVMSYIFGLQQVPDLLYDFFSIVRRKLDLSTSIVVSSYSVQQICLLMMEDLKPTGGSLLIKLSLHKLDQAPDFRLKTLLRVGTKYPLLFWSLQKFRRSYKRFVFGDKFWPGRKCLKLKAIEILDFPSDFNDWFVNEPTATKITAIHIIGDIVNSTVNEWTFSDAYCSPLVTITYEQITRLKEVVGYKIATKLLIESEIPHDFNPIFAAPFISHHDGDQPHLSDMENHGGNEVEKQKVVDTDTQHEEDEEPSSQQITEIEEQPFEDIIDEEDHEEFDEENDEYSDVRNKSNKDDSSVGVIIHDDVFNREFAYNLQSGRSRWAKIVVDEAGQTLVYKFE